MADTHNLPQPENDVTELITDYIFSSLEVAVLSECIHNPLPPSATADEDSDTLLSDYISSFFVNEVSKTLLSDHSISVSPPSKPLASTGETIISDDTLELLASTTGETIISSTTYDSPAESGVSNPNTLPPVTATSAILTLASDIPSSSVRQRKKSPPESQSDSPHPHEDHIPDSGVLRQDDFFKRTAEVEIFEEDYQRLGADIENQNPPNDDLNEPLLQSKVRETTKLKMEKNAKWCSSFFALTPLVACGVAVIERNSAGTPLTNIAKFVFVAVNAVICWGTWCYLYGGPKANLQRIVRLLETIYKNVVYLGYVQALDLLFSVCIHRIPGIFSTVELCLVKTYVVFVIKFLGTKKMVEDAAIYTTIFTLPICGLFLFERDWEALVIFSFMVAANITVWTKGEMLYKYFGKEQEQEQEGEVHEHGA